MRRPGLTDAILRATGQALLANQSLRQSIERFLTVATNPLQPRWPGTTAPGVRVGENADYREPVAVDRPGGQEVAIEHRYERGTEVVTVRVTFSHLASVDSHVAIGAAARNQIIGRTGTSGNADTPHAHVEIGARLRDRNLGPVSPIGFFGVDTSGAAP